jgi:hypothetical protein
MVDRNNPEFIRPNTSIKPTIVRNTISNNLFMSCNSVEIDAVPHANSRFDSEVWDEETVESFRQDILDGMFGG